MSGLTPRTPGLPPIEKLEALRQQIEQAATPEDAAGMADNARILKAALHAANQGLDIRNEAAELFLRAERKLGSLLDDVVQHGVRSIPDGITSQRVSRARMLAAIPGELFDTFLENTKASQREISQRGALQLLPAKPREERSNVAATYTAPAIDVQIAREFGLDASDDRAQLIVDALTRALATIENPRHAFVWAKYHGIMDDGTMGERWTYAGIAQSMGVSREYVENLYYRASHHIRGYLAVAALDRLALVMHAA